MNKSDYKSPLNELRAQLRQKKKERAALDSEIIKLEKVVDGLTLLAKEASGEINSLTLDEAILNIFYDDRAKLTARAVKKRLEQGKFDFSGYNNPAAYVHVTLKRLKDKRKLKAEPTEDGLSFWLPEEPSLKFQSNKVAEIGTKT